MKPNYVGWWHALLGLLFPKCTCFSCGEQGELDETGLCSKCRHQLESTGSDDAVCLVCPTFIPKGKEYCINCRQKMEHWFEAARAVFPYEGPLRGIIHDFKYRKMSKWAKPLGLLMLHTVQKDGRFGNLDLVVPVPLHINRQNKRGFNQSELLAREIGMGLKLPVVANLLTRQVDTPSQTGLDKNDRHKNLDGAFQLKETAGIQGKNILLVDDIYTTGATVEACSRILKIRGAKGVWVITCAAGKSQ